MVPASDHKSHLQRRSSVPKNHSGMALERLNPTDVYAPYAGVYTQVVRASGGVQIEVAGTVSLDTERQLVGEGDMAAQVTQGWANLGASLAAAGAGFADVTRINIFTTDVDAYLEHGTPVALRIFGDAPPAATLAGVTRLADPRYLVEIEAVAVLD